MVHLFFYSQDGEVQVETLPAKPVRINCSIKRRHHPFHHLTHKDFIQTLQAQYEDGAIDSAKVYYQLQKLGTYMLANTTDELGHERYTKYLHALLASNASHITPDALRALGIAVDQ
jgi:hypothetical protein